MDTLLVDLFKAYYDARRNKRNTPSQLRFEMDLETNLIDLYHELRDRRYKPLPSVCFIIHDSVKREVFASDFRDRVVHHLYYNYISPSIDRQFIFDSYSCRKGKGTLMGIVRLEKHIRSVSRNYTRKAYVLKMDIQGYFMSINRERLCEMVHNMTERIKLPKEAKTTVDYLTDTIILKDPMLGAKFKGNPTQWYDLPPSKCLRFSPKGVGLPIGDLTSQLYSNIFLNYLDRFITMTLGFKHYGRYVDDFYIVDSDRKRLTDAVQIIQEMLISLGLKLHHKKITIKTTDESITYLGAVLYPYYKHCSSHTMKKYLNYKHIYISLYEQDNLNVPIKEIVDKSRCISSMNSYRGYLKHFRTTNQLL